MKKFSTEAEMKMFAMGSAYTLAYIAFCYNNYVYKMNYGGCFRFLQDLSNFCYEGDYIPNTKKITFDKFCEEYSVEK